MNEYRDRIFQIRIHKREMFFLSKIMSRKIYIRRDDDVRQFVFCSVLGLINERRSYAHTT